MRSLNLFLASLDCFKTPKSNTLNKQKMTHQFEIWNNNNRGGISDTFSGTQGQDNIMGNTDSLETNVDTWVIVFNKPNYDGDSMQISPSSYYSDLNHTDRYDSSGHIQGDWKSQIQSFILYNAQPSYWGHNPTKEQLFELILDGQALFTEDTNFLGENRTFIAPFNASCLENYGWTTNGVEMSTNLNGKINSLRTGFNAWLTIYNDFHFEGDFRLIEPDKACKDLNQITRYDSNGNSDGDWKNQIKSFLLFKEKPAFWDTNYPRPYIDFHSLYNLFPGTTGDENDKKITYTVADSTYCIENPSVSMQSTTQIPANYTTNDDMDDLPADGWTKYHVSLSHKNTGGKNDKAEFDMFFDNSGKLVNIQHFTWSSDGAYNISNQFIKIVDTEVWILGTIGAPETLGISEAVADEFIEDFDMICEVFNKIANLVYNKTDNGGQYYFLPVICHAINRICTTILNTYNKPIYTNPQDIRANLKWSFNYTGFNNAINTQLSPNGHVNSNWTLKSGLKNQNMPFDQVIEYQYNESNQAFKYRTWYQEVSFSTEIGMLVSCKIDYEIDSDKDDHIILLMGFRIPSENSTTPLINFARATVQFTDNSNENINIPICSGDDCINDVYNQLSSSISNVSTNNSTQGRKHLADIAKANMNAIMSCILFN